MSVSHVDVLVLTDYFLDLVNYRVVTQDGIANLSDEEVSMVQALLRGHSTLDSWRHLARSEEDSTPEAYQEYFRRLNSQTTLFEAVKCQFTGEDSCVVLDWAGTWLPEVGPDLIAGSCWTRGQSLPFDRTRVGGLGFDSPKKDDFFQSVQVLRAMLVSEAIREVVSLDMVSRVAFGDLMGFTSAVVVLEHSWPESSRVWQFQNLEDRAEDNHMSELFFGLRHGDPMSSNNLGPRCSSTFAIQECRALLAARKVICRSPYQRDELVGVYGLDPSRVEVAVDDGDVAATVGAYVTSVRAS